MNAAKILPRGSDRLPADKVGVQRKTKVNIEAWRRNKVENHSFKEVSPQQELALCPALVWWDWQKWTTRPP